MPATLTLNNVPDDLYERLQMAANANHRSVNSEAILCLENMFLPAKQSRSEQLASIRALRQSLGTPDFSADSISQFKHQGRA
jgi:plasmid stability protein